MEEMALRRHRARHKEVPIHFEAEQDEGVEAEWCVSEQAMKYVPCLAEDGLIRCVR